MILTTTPTIDGKEIISYRGVIGAEVIFGANVLKDAIASVTDLIGGRSGLYEKVFADAREKALGALRAKAREAQASAVVAIRFDYHSVGSMMMVAATGTAVQIAKTDEEKAKDAAYEDRQAAAHFVAIEGIEKGPFSIEQIGELVTSGKVSIYGHARTEGVDEKKMVAHLIAR